MHLWHHFLSVMRQPRGRADKAGSQQASFAMPIPSQMWAATALFGARWMGNVRYTVSPSTGAIEWVPTKAITSYYIDDPAAMDPKAGNGLPAPSSRNRWKFSSRCASRVAACARSAASAMIPGDASPTSPLSNRHTTVKVSVLAPAPPAPAPAAPCMPPGGVL